MLTFPKKNTFIHTQQRIALIEAILCPEREYRYYHYDAHWYPGQHMASMRDGEGREWFALIDVHGIAITARAQAPADPTVYQDLPAYWRGDNFLNEPSFSTAEGNYCAWKSDSDPAWQSRYPIANEAELAAMFLTLHGNAETYSDFAADYHERDINRAAVRHILSSAPFNPDDALALNPDLDPDDLQAELHDIGILTNRSQP